jgi:hypothetical protein
MICPKRSTSVTVFAARANPTAMTKGTATEARATYFMTTPVTADLAWLMSPANTAASYDFQRAPSTKPTAATTARVAIG